MAVAGPRQADTSVKCLGPIQVCGKNKVHQDQAVSFLLGNAEDTVGSLPARSHLLHPLFQKQSLSLSSPKTWQKTKWGWPFEQEPSD